MSDRDARVEAAARALWRANRRDGKPQTYPYDRLIEPTREDLLGLAEAALAAADAVQSLPTPGEVYGILAGYQTEDEVVANRRMVDLDAAAGWIADNVPGVGHAQKFRSEFGDSAASEDQP